MTFKTFIDHLLFIFLTLFWGYHFTFLFLLLVYLYWFWTIKNMMNQKIMANAVSFFIISIFLILCSDKTERLFMTSFILIYADL